MALLSLKLRKYTKKKRAYLTYNDIGTTVFKMIMYEKKTSNDMVVEPCDFDPSLVPNVVPGIKYSQGR